MQNEQQAGSQRTGFVRLMYNSFGLLSVQELNLHFKICLQAYIFDSRDLKNEFYFFFEVFLDLCFVPKFNMLTWLRIYKKIIGQRVIRNIHSHLIVDDLMNFCDSVAVQINSRRGVADLNVQNSLSKTVPVVGLLTVLYWSSS